jgi:hypothetical protein
MDLVQVDMLCACLKDRLTTQNRKEKLKLHQTEVIKSKVDKRELALRVINKVHTNKQTIEKVDLVDRSCEKKLVEKDEEHTQALLDEREKHKQEMNIQSESCKTKLDEKDKERIENTRGRCKLVLDYEAARYKKSFTRLAENYKNRVVSKDKELARYAEENTHLQKLLRKRDERDFGNLTAQETRQDEDHSDSSTDTTSSDEDRM